MNKKIYIALAALALVVILIVQFNKKEEGTTVLTEESKIRTIVEKVAASGKVQPEMEVSISSDVSGEIVELPVIEGQKVNKGQLLAKINPDIYQSVVTRMEASVNSSKASVANSKARLVQVQAQLKNAELSFDRNKKLFSDGVISTAEYDQSEANYMVAKAEVEAAEESVNSAIYTEKSAEASLKEAYDNLKRTSIYAPVDGTISMLSVELGERVVGTAQMTGTEMMRIADLTSMEVNVEVNESDIVRVHMGDSVSIEVDAYRDRTFYGKVTEIANSSNTQGVASSDQVTIFEVKVHISEDSYHNLVQEDQSHLSPFRPGMSATVEVLTETVTEVVTVPIEAVTLRPDSTIEKSKYGNINWDEVEEDQTIECVFVLEGDSAKQIPVILGIQDNQFIEIKQGIEPGMTVITGPYSLVSRKLEDGDKVMTGSKSEVFSD